MKEKSKSKDKGPFKEEFETFKNINNIPLYHMCQDKPTCFNGTVSIRRYRVLIQEIMEPREVLQERLQALWETERNYLSIESMQAYAAELGMTLTGAMGSKASK
jgi:hypothetical protein